MDRYAVDGRQARGAQVGAGNVQQNSFAAAPTSKPAGGAPRRVFVSHTAELRELPEDGSFIAAVEKAIAAAGDAVMDMAYYTASDLPPAQLDRDNVAKADIYLLVVGFHYGSPVRERPELSYTEHEFQVAGELGKPRLVFLIEENAVGPGRLFRDPRNGAKQEVFRQQLLDSGLTVRQVTSPDDLTAAVLQALTAEPYAQSPVVRVWNIPARQVRFTGREDHLAALSAALAERIPAVVQALNGMGGVGKTALANEYAHRHAEEYDVAWWIPAEDPDLIPEHLATLACALGLAASNDSTPASVARLLGELRESERWLLVFDNAEDPSALTPFLPSGAGHVLISSRNPDWNDLAAPVEVSEFTRAESVALLGSRLPELADAGRLAEALGDLPLAVDQAAALLVDTGWAVDRYLELLESSTRRVLDRRGKPSGYATSVAAAWQVTIDRLADTDPAAAQLLTLAAWMAPRTHPADGVHRVPGTFA